jgi:hypothetical protein
MAKIQKNKKDNTKFCCRCGGKEELSFIAGGNEN